MATTDESWNFMDYSSKGRLLDVLQREIDDTFKLIGDPERWQARTACERWEVRDVIGHLVDTTEGYLPAFDIARNGGIAPEPHGLVPMAELVDEGAKSLRKVPRGELIERLEDDSKRMMQVFSELSEEDWTGLIVAHAFMPPLPSMFYPAFQLVDYAVHGWDIREGIGEPHGLAGDSSDLLVPLIFILWQATADVSTVKEPFTVGVVTSGSNGGETRIDITSEGMQYEPGDVSTCDAVLEFDPATLVLTGYARMNGGTFRGDPEVASRFRSLFFRI